MIPAIIVEVVVGIGALVSIIYLVLQNDRLKTEVDQLRAELDRARNPKG